MQIRSHGIISALMTPFNAEHAVDLDGLKNLVSYQQKLGVSGFFVCGNTARYYLLSEEERKQILETVIDVVEESTVIAHVGSRDLRVAVRLARHAEQVGADGVGSILPNYTFEASREYYRILAEATDLPLLAYIFQRNGDVDLDFVRELTQIPNFKGVKFTAFDLYKLERIKQMNGGQCLVLSGEDEAFAGAQVMGADGAIGSTYNFMPDVYVRVKDALQEGDMIRAREFQSFANDQTEMLKEVDVARGIRQVLADQGVIAGHFRPPISPLDPREKEICRKVVENLQDFRASGREIPAG